jgi:hypothetical protein
VHFFAVYLGELTAEDRIALDRPGFKVYENGVGIKDSFVWQAEGASSEFTMAHQVVRVTAASAADARQQIVEALGREPDGLRVHPG